MNVREKDFRSIEDIFGVVEENKRRKLSTKLNMDNLMIQATSE